jgi:serine/threonine-protein kinase HipA
MTDSLLVIVGDAIAGTVTRAKGGKLEFRYDERYQANEALTPLSVSMQVENRVHPDHVITPWLWNLLPDNDAVLLRWARQFYVSASSAFSLLSTPVGEDCAGAVRFVQPDNADRALARTGSVTWLTEDDVAERLRELRRDSSNWLGTAFTGQFSLAGAQAKTALLYQDGRWGVPSGATPTTHILKPAIDGLDEHDLNEHLCLDAARRVGLLTVSTRVQRFGDQSALVVERYDRIERDGLVLRVHQEDLCQALAVPPGKKYQSDGGPSVRQIVALMHDVMSATPARDAILRFTDALIWNWLIGGTDAHAKNYSLLLHGNLVRLAPLYDIASILPYGMHEKKLRLAMKIGKEYQLNPYRNRWPEAAADLGLHADQVVSRVCELAARAPDAFADAAAAVDSDLPTRLTDLVAGRASRCAGLCEIT